jgi:uncharacterized protein YbaR (Trm112 family)
MISPDLLEILCCPETHQGLREAKPTLIDKLNQQIAAGTLRNRGGQPVKEKIEGGLMRADNTLLYSIRQNIPVLLVDEAIPVTAM